MSEASKPTVKLKRGRGRPPTEDPQIIIDKASHRIIQRHNHSNILTIPYHITEMFHIKPSKKTMNNDRSYQATSLDISYNKADKSLLMVLDQGTKHTYSTKTSQYVIIPMNLAKQHGFTAGSHVAVIPNEEKRTIKAILDTPKTIPKTGKAICLAALERVKDLETALETALETSKTALKAKDTQIKSMEYAESYLKAHLKGGTSDPLNKDFWLTPILNKMNDENENKETLNDLLSKLFHTNDWVNSALFVVWAWESYNINKAGITQHLFNITRPPYDIKEDMKSTKKYIKLKPYKEHIEPLINTENQLELRKIMEKTETYATPIP